MAELAHARAELAQLQSTEKTLVEQLLAVRVAIETQKSKISKLVEDRPSLINRLPIELLTKILGFLLVSSGGDRYRFFRSLPKLRKNLAGVSRFWRDVTRNTPVFWSNIGLTRDSDSYSLMTQLKRSRECFLDIVILNPYEGSLDALLDTLIPSAIRWRSLTVQVPSILLSGIICKLDRYKFPCLEDVFIDMRNCAYPQFLLPTHCPVLRHLDLRGLCMTEDFFSTASTTLTTLSLSMGLIRDQLFLSRIPTQSLTSLTITGACPDHDRNWVLEHDAVCFPVLRRLLIDTRDPHLFMDAIVTPKLEHFVYAYHPGPIFHAFGSKFNHVCHFTSLPRLRKGISSSRVAHILCRNFSGVRYASLPAIDIATFFMPTCPPDDSVPQTPADSWESLERLTVVCNIDDGYRNVDTLAKWLTKRQGLGLPSLHVQLAGSPFAHMTIEEFSFRYNQLRDCRVLSFEGIRLSHTLYPSTDGSLLHRYKGGQQGQHHFAQLAEVTP
ncbi:hypothetical protein F5141DRAFT_1218909 [Pisolithus sp. B1]|nr:hypothetical protein F5141DRAFT_1218909 [Pisolithus sp. B1]